jgi:hypothetical protein
MQPLNVHVHFVDANDDHPKPSRGKLRSSCPSRRRMTSESAQSVSEVSRAAAESVFFRRSPLAFRLSRVQLMQTLPYFLRTWHGAKQQPGLGQLATGALKLNGVGGNGYFARR